AAIPDRYQCTGTCMLEYVFAVSGQRSKVFRGKLNRTLIFPSHVMQLAKKARRQKAKLEISEHACDRQSLGTGRQCLIRLAKKRIGVRQVCMNTTSTAIIFQFFGEPSCLTQRIQHQAGTTKVDLGRPLFDADFERLLERVAGLWKRPENTLGLLEP